jgi:hypothetical protein
MQNQQPSQDSSTSHHSQQQHQQQQQPLVGQSVCQQPGSPAYNALQQCGLLQQDAFGDVSHEASSSGHEDDCLMDFWVLLQQTQHNLQVRLMQACIITLQHLPKFYICMQACWHL